MKKKTGLFTIIMCVLLGVMVVTWLVPASSFSGGELAELGMYRIGFFDFFQLLFGSFQFAYFIQILTLLVMIGAFYGVLNKTGKYKAIINNIASKFKGKENVFLIGASLFIALLTSVFDFGLITFIIIPAIISVVLAMKYDKITAFITTFGAYLVGVIGNTLSSNVILTINSVLTDVTLYDGIWFKIALFVICYGILALCLVKAKKVSSKELENADMFIDDTETSKLPSWPLILIFAIVFVLLILGCVDWSGVFEIEFFNNLHSSITSMTVGKNDLTLVAFILGNINAFGSWHYAEMAVICLLAAILVGLIYRLGLSKTFEAMWDGIKKMFPTAALVILVYTVVYFTGNTLSYPTIAGWILGATSKFNLLFTSIATIFGSALHVDILYVASYVGAQVAATTTNQVLIGVLLQSLYGLTMFVVPTSAMLVLGLSYLNIPYKEWLKKSWTLILELFIAILVVLLVMALV